MDEFNQSISKDQTHRAMKVVSSPVVVIVLVLTAGVARGEGLLYQLPKDGTWARYECTTTAESGGATVTVPGSVWIASVGQVTVNDETCRWIEVRIKKETVKALVPEKLVAKGKLTIDHVVRAWVRAGDRVSKKLEHLRVLLKGPDIVFFVTFSPAMQNVKQLEAKTVSSKLGKLSCLGVTGTYQGRKIDITFESRLHSKSPFGVISSRWDIQIDSEEQGRRTVTWNLHSVTLVTMRKVSCRTNGRSDPAS